MTHFSTQNWHWISLFASHFKMTIPNLHLSPPLHNKQRKERADVDHLTVAHLAAVIWSSTSYVPSLRFIACIISSPWYPLPLPSKLATMTCSVLARYVAQLIWKVLSTFWLQGPAYLSEKCHRTQTFTLHPYPHTERLKCNHCWSLPTTTEE